MKGQTKAHYLAPKPKIIDRPKKLSISYMKEANRLLYHFFFKEKKRDSNYSNYRSAFHIRDLLSFYRGRKDKVDKMVGR